MPLGHEGHNEHNAKATSYMSRIAHPVGELWESVTCYFFIEIVVDVLINRFFQVQSHFPIHRNKITGKPNMPSDFSATKLGSLAAWRVWIVAVVFVAYQFSIQTGYAIVNGAVQADINLNVTQIGTIAAT